MLEFVEGINPNVETIVLTGFVNRLVGDKSYIDTLYFTTKPVQLIKETFKNGKHSTSKKTKRKKTATICSEGDTKIISGTD